MCSCLVLNLLLWCFSVQCPFWLVGGSNLLGTLHKRRHSPRQSSISTTSRLQFCNYFFPSLASIFYFCHSSLKTSVHCPFGWLAGQICSDHSTRDDTARGNNKMQPISLQLHFHLFPPLFTFIDLKNLQQIEVYLRLFIINGEMDLLRGS